mgnify:CR=1 FL=1
MRHCRRLIKRNKGRSRLSLRLRSKRDSRQLLMLELTLNRLPGSRLKPRHRSTRKPARRQR